MYSRLTHPDSSRKSPRTNGLNLQLADFNQSFTNSEGKIPCQGSPNFDFIPREVTPTCTTPPGTSFPDTQMVLKWQQCMRVTLLNWRSTMILRVKDGCKTSMLLAGVLFEFKFQLNFFRRELLCRHSCYNGRSHGITWYAWYMDKEDSMESRSHCKRRWRMRACLCIKCNTSILTPVWRCPEASF